MEYSRQSSSVKFWDERAKCEGIHSVFSRRWSIQECDEVNKNQIAIIDSLLGDYTGLNILDLGCGIGRLSNVFAEKADTVIGIDISSQMIARARKERLYDNISFEVCSVTDLPFSDSYFDIIVSSFVFQHIFDDREFSRGLQEIKRITKNNGKLLIIDGLEEKVRIPDNSQITKIRRLVDYTKEFGEEVEYRKKVNFTCIEDKYTAILLQKSTLQ